MNGEEQLAALVYEARRITEKMDEIMKSIEDLKKTVLKLREKEVSEEDAMVNEEIRDMVVHRSKIISLAPHDIVTIFIRNELDQDITVQVKGNWAETHLGAVDIGSSFTVPSNDVAAYNLSVYRETWLPFSFCEVKANALPSKGAVHIKYLKRFS